MNVGSLIKSAIDRVESLLFKPSSSDSPVIPNNHGEADRFALVPEHISSFERKYTPQGVFGTSILTHSSSRLCPEAANPVERCEEYYDLDSIPGQSRFQSLLGEAYQSFGNA